MQTDTCEPCDCSNCWEVRMEGRPWTEQLQRHMHLCPTCGNKRCPKATDHRNDCSGSNEPGQRHRYRSVRHEEERRRHMSNSKEPIEDYLNRELTITQANNRKLVNTIKKLGGDLAVVRAELVMEQVRNLESKAWLQAKAARQRAEIKRLTDCVNALEAREEERTQ